MNAKIITLIGIALLLAGVWFSKSGRQILHAEKQEAVLKCTADGCGHEFTKVLPMPFDKFPVACPKCGQKTAFAMTSCEHCGAHYPVNTVHPLEKCPACGVDLKTGLMEPAR